VNSPWVLVVAGADSSARAGIAADREALEAQAVGIQSVVSVWSAQDSTGMHAFSPLEAKVWLRVARQKLQARPAVLKFGLLPGASHLRAAARLSSEALGMGIPVLLDPVICSSSGYTFLDAAALSELRSGLLKQAIILTPNLAEGLALAEAGEEEGLPSPARRLELAQELLELGPRAILFKGGHGQEDPVCDLVLERDLGSRWHHHSRLEGQSMGGSGCRYASSVAGALARGVGLFEAAQLAGNYVASRLGKNCHST
jgi:hydroxymethylpyrimidine/phosphomethylpyrimidine kinase